MSLADIVDSASVASQEQLRDYAVEGIVPQAAVLPSNVDAVSEVLAQAGEEGRSVVPWGGGTLMSLGNVPRSVDLVLGLGRLDRLLAHEAGDLIATVEAGISLQDLQDQLALHGQFLPIQAPLPSRSTIGGILAANASGPSRLTYGLARDWLIGIKVVHANGSITKSGGRVVKNVTGYDLNKLYVGSLGTLGVIVEATFKVAPIPPDRCTLVAGYAYVSSAIEAAQDLLGQPFTPHALHVLSRDLCHWFPQIDPSQGQQDLLLVLLEGRPRSLSKKVEDTETTLRQTGAISIGRLGTAESSPFWQGLTDLGWGGELESPLMLKVITPPSAMPELLRSATDPTLPVPLAPVVVDPGFGMARFIWPNPQEPLPDQGSVEVMAASLRLAAQVVGGHVVVERCPLLVKERLDVWGDPIEGYALMRQIKEELDPKGILNPGRYVGRM